jgi:hypothetical protein
MSLPRLIWSFSHLSWFRSRLIWSLSLAFVLACVLAAQEMHPAARTTPAFDQLKSLAGEWQGKTPAGAPVKVTYQVVSNGSTVMEHLQPANEPDMVTMYTLDGDRLVVTHYCSAGNQPSMQTAPLTSASGKYDFTLAHLGGAKSPEEGHMQSLSLTIADKDHLTQVWTFADHGKTQTETFNYTRKS